MKYNKFADISDFLIELPSSRFTFRGLNAKTFKSTALRAKSQSALHLLRYF